MKENAHERGKMAEKIVLLPDARPGKIKQDRTHHAADDHQNRAQDPIHLCEKSPGLILEWSVNELAFAERRCARPRRDSQC